ncbi:lysoplasmalogenase [Kordia jejudonensis]|uniref:lysoplasmalogenase n=1 Tax=Kordia jejudonensis TaxID=1348245 RepID=UPI000629030E|nr:lysoplasmalogenase [Kordia jejudonensis]
MKFFKVFLFLFLVNLSLDIYFNNAKEFYDLRLFTKPLITIFLAVFFYVNSLKMALRTRVIILLALSFLCAGDIILLEDTPFYSFLTGLCLFLAALLLYSFHFYRETTYDIDRLLPFLAASLLISLTLIYLMYDGLGYMLIPVMVYISVVLNLMKIAFLRLKNVNKISYILVFVAAICFTIAQIIIGLHSFHKAIPNKDIFIMLFYGISQLLFIFGILVTEHTEHHHKITAKN